MQYSIIFFVFRLLIITVLIGMTVYCSSKKQSSEIAITHPNPIKDSVQQKAKAGIIVTPNVEADTCDLCTDLNQALNCKKYVTTLYIDKRLTLSQMKDLRTLSNLEYLSLKEIKNLNLNVLIESLSKLNKFKELHILECTIRTLPENIYTLKSLRELSITDSCLKSISPHIQLPDSLEILSLREGLSILVFNKSYKQLKVLDLSNNTHFTSLDETVSYLENLSKLNLQYTQVKYLPNQAEMLSDLKELRLGFTPLAQNAQNRLQRFRLANPKCKIYLHIPLAIE